MNVNSVKDRLKNYAKQTNKTMQDVLVMYGLERTIYRISISEYRERFTLKGGIYLYALFDGAYARATTDIDLLAQQLSNNAEELKRVFTDIFSVECDDALRYDKASIETIPITEFKEYHGVKVSVKAYLDKTRIPISIDVGFGDVIYPNRVCMKYPTILDMETPQIYAYTMVTAVAEKFEAIVSLGYANSRYKDFYDIYMIATQYDLNGNLLQWAVKETFQHRATTYEDIVAFDDEFATDAVRQNRWNAFIKKKHAMQQVELKEVLAVMKRLLEPIVDSIEKDEDFNYEWSKSECKWLNE